MREVAVETPRTDSNLPSTGQVVTLSLFRFRSVGDRVWAFLMMGLARWPLARLKGIGFWKLMGAGTGEGFTPLPDTGAVAILATWPDLETAERQIAGSEIYRRYLLRSDETMTFYLTPFASRGSWSGKAPFQPEGGPPGRGLVAALTRATLRPAVLLRFWSRVPDISKAIGENRDVVFKLGVGEVPWFHQMTFSIWPDTETMAAFARADGPHSRAIRAVREGEWFSEELYARFSILAARGTWNGRNPVGARDLPIAAQ